MMSFTWRIKQFWRKKHFSSSRRYNILGLYLVAKIKELPFTTWQVMNIAKTYDIFKKSQNLKLYMNISDNCIKINKSVLQNKWIHGDILVRSIFLSCCLYFHSRARCAAENRLFLKSLYDMLCRNSPLFFSEFVNP